MRSFLTGLAAGLAVGYLTAPRSGKETRNQLTETANRQTQGLKDQLSKTSSKVSQLINDVKPKSTPDLFADQAESKFNRYQYNDELAQVVTPAQYNSTDNATDVRQTGAAVDDDPTLDIPVRGDEFAAGSTNVNIDNNQETVRL